MLRNNKNDLAQSITYLFNTIYNAAKNKDVATLQQLREQYRPIKLKPYSNVAMLTDEKRYYTFPNSLFSQDNYLCVYSNGTTPIQLLASQGEIEAVDFLLSHGADPYEAVLGYAMQEIYNKKDAILGYAFIGNAEKVNQLIANEISIDSLEKDCAAIQGYSMGGYLELAAEIINRYSSVNILAQSAFALARHYPACHPAFGYPAILQQYYAYLANNAPITLQTVLSYGFTHDLVKTSSIEKLNHLIVKFNLNYHQAAAWIDPAFFTMAMDGVALVRNEKLPLDVFTTILGLVSRLNYNETLATFDQITLNCHLILLKNAIDLYNKPLYDSHRFHSNRAKSFKQACEEVKSTKELHGLIRYQHRLFTHPEEARINNQLSKAHELPLKNNVNDKFTEILEKLDQRLEGRYKI